MSFPTILGGQAVRRRLASWSLICEGSEMRYVVCVALMALSMMVPVFACRYRR